ncbi:flagellar hook protein FlgE [Sphingomonas gellani]|uniref:Flagellar hook protein FlgE n=1 Tax=Sphingomonas gellani TaxID=1166340 RepID=A0A1H8CKZ0_9SPHN|nr:flagellar hook protein FlgE [Sphingomonas gellani]SEM95612.1 flagellar hook protein FlgE [Sphingomonas gellani]
MSFYNSLSGLQASQTDMSVISHNLANVATTGFKKSRTDFADVMASSVAVDPTKMVGSGVVVKGNRQQFGEGNLTTTSSSLDLAISGDGFFTVKTSGNASATAYTRNGSFQIDPQRNIVDAQGSYLQVYPVDAEGNVTATGADGLTPVKLPDSSGIPVATKSVTLGVNLSPTGAVSTKTFDRADPSTFNNSTATTIYDATGNAQTMTSYFVRTKASTDTDPTSNWSVYTYVGDQPMKTGGSTAPTQLTFTSGKLTSPTGATTFDAYVPAGSASNQTLKLDLTGSTQLSSVFSVGTRSQDGKATGQLAGVTVDTNGVLTASFSNGDTKKLGKVALANFTDPAGLKQLGNSYWSATGISGNAKMGAANENGYGNMMSGTLEGSNVDITEELVALIAAQRNFQANAKALDTQSQISQTIFNIRS